MDWKKLPRKFAPFALTASALIISACATAPTATNAPAAQASTWENQNFGADGKIALRYPRCDQYRGCSQEAVSAKYHWEHRQNLDQLSLYDPTGQEQLRLNYQGQNVTVTNGSETRTLSRQELAQELGISVPVEDLRSWLFTQKPAGSFEASGWKVTPENWQGTHYQRLTLTRPDYYLRLIVSTIKKR